MPKSHDLQYNYYYFLFIDNDMIHTNHTVVYKQNKKTNYIAYANMIFSIITR